MRRRSLKWEGAAIALLAAASILTARALPREVPTGLLGRFWSSPDWTGQPTAEARGSLPTSAALADRLPQHGLLGGSAEWTGFLFTPPLALQRSLTQ